MINKKDFKNMKKDLESFDDKREILIKSSRDVLKLSKQVIYALHRSDNDAAKKHVATIRKEFTKLDKLASESCELSKVGAYRVAVQEYVEALCYYGYVIDKKIPTSKELKVISKLYLLGICDLSGELVRKAINDAIKGEMSSALEIKELVEMLYGELLNFDFRDGETRKKFDSIKYNLKRLEDLALNIKLKE